jgi:Tol biopolymer transport system component
VYLHDLLTGRTTCESVTRAGVPGNDHSGGAALSGDSRYLAFESAATNLVPGDTNAAADVFVKDRLTGRTDRVSVGNRGQQAAQFLGGMHPQISRDGRFLAFESFAENLVTGDSNGEMDVFVRDRTRRTTVRASVTSAGEQGDGVSTLSSISADGRSLALVSLATNLVPDDTNDRSDVFWRRLR